MKRYVKDAVKELLHSENLKKTVTLKHKKDMKRCFCRRLYNKTILTVQKKIVPCHFKNWLLRTTGMDVGHDACIPHDITFDTEFPELISLGRGCIVGGESVLITHKTDGRSLTIGKVILKERVLIGGCSILQPGSVVGKHSILSMMSDLQGTMGEGQLWEGKPAVHKMDFSKEDIEKYFKPSNGQYKHYYKTFRKEVDAFLKDPKKNYFKIHYNGKRLNAGNDWWRARNVFRIWYNGALVELTRLLPHCGFKTMLLRMVGVKIGKNVFIGKGVVFDHLFGDNITVEDDVRIDDMVYLDGHEYTISQTIFGKSVVKKGAHLKYHSFVRIGTIIGEWTVIEPYGFAQKEIPANEVWGGTPAKFIRKR